ncbi:PatU [Brasilonema sp. UFV-L1]|uniref:PatU n=1 Tax=Brasilonema sp. UFV-L1 TaxID=2234130 RepID=UPI00145DBDDA|nr:PatU [Brasilonema sp. UFV-L1]NMG06952.1 PatU [Brasilonema sp. UFV-L1]
MNSDSESSQHQLIAWLLAKNAQTNDPKLVNCEDNEGGKHFHQTAATSNGGAFELKCVPQTFQLGEIPTVQERFQAVLKRRLQTQIQNHPPLFPWETQLTDYPECVDKPLVELVPVWSWAAQLSKLNLPVPLPEKIFQHLLEKCQAMIASSMPLGAKLVQAVDSLFPEDSQTLNDLAGLVLRTPSRSVDTLETMPNLENDYSDLQPRQQMALSLLAAKQLLENLTLPVSVSNPVVERQWLTSLGIITLKVEYKTQGQVTKLRVQTELPSKAVVKLQGDASQAIAESSSPGCLSVELHNTQPNQTYTLEVQLKEIDQRSLLFVIVPTV